MSRPLKIAMYSGEVPSTTFIERLILGLSKTDCTIYLFGVRHKRVSYSPNVKVITYTHNRFTKFLHLITYTILLSLFKHKDKKKLDDILKSQSKNLIYSKVKSYPVLWHRPDIFHIQWAKGLEEWAWVQQFGMKLVLSLRGAHINYSPIADPQLAAMYRTYFPQVDGFHAVSNAIAKEASIYGASLDRTKVIYSGLNLDAFHFKQEKNNHVFQMISVGRPHWVKGYTYALDAMKILKDFNLKFHYTIIGAGSDIELLYQVKDLELNDHVTLLDVATLDQVKLKIQSSDVLLVSSVKEGIANVGLEAMALGTLVLSTDCGGMAEVIDDGLNGYLVPIRHPKAIADAVLKVVRLDPEASTAILEAALQTIASQHSESQMVEGMMGLYRRVMGG